MAFPLAQAWVCRLQWGRAAECRLEPVLEMQFVSDPAQQRLMRLQTWPGQGRSQRWHRQAGENASGRYAEAFVVTEPADDLLGIGARDRKLRAISQAWIRRSG